MSRNICLTQLFDWKCSCTGDCLRSIKFLEDKREAILAQVMQLRNATFRNPEQQIQSHTLNVLRTLTRTSRSRVQFMLTGNVEVCKEAFCWAHGFSEGSFNRAHAAFNNEFQAANPQVLVDMVRAVIGCRSTADFSLCSDRTKLRRKCQINYASDKNLSTPEPRVPRNGSRNICS